MTLQEVIDTAWAPITEGRYRLDVNYFYDGSVNKSVRSNNLAVLELLAERLYNGCGTGDIHTAIIDTLDGRILSELEY